MQQVLSQVQSQRQLQILAPQMRQSLEVLQAPLMELRTLLQHELEQNPALEERPDDHEPLEVDEGAASATDYEGELKFKEEYERLTRLGDEWQENFMQNTPRRRSTAEDQERHQRLLDSLTQEETLQEHLVRQLGLVSIPERERRLATLLIGCINEDGYLNSTLGEIAETTASDMATLERLLILIQEMDPVGVGARDLRECLLLQLERRGRTQDSVEARIIRDHLDGLAAHRHTELARALKVPVSAVHEASKLIASLDPKPGRPFSGKDPVYVVPEITVSKQNGAYVCVMNNERLPRMRISPHYRQLMEREDTPKETKDYIRERIRAGTILIHSIEQRQQTILNIAREIVRVQTDFFEHGITQLRPLVMSEIAKKLDIHETTVSRAVSGKFMDTPRGVFEMKFFFTPGYRTANGEEVSNKVIKDAIGEWVAHEDPSAPLSDQDMARMMAEKGVPVARRTIAKYRDELRIPPSHLRRG